MRRSTTSASPSVPLFRTVRSAVFGLIITAGAGLLLGCNGGSDTMNAVDMAQRSCCGKSGDVGNSKGVGKYCTSNTDPACRSSGLPANICSTAENNINRPTFFCTLPCTDANDTTTCGEAAKCTKNSLGMFGCVPQSCLDNLPPGCPL